MTRIPPIRRETLVAASPEVAFTVFTERIGTWWPLGELGVFRDGTVAFAGGRIVESSASGEEAVWGTVTGWDPPLRIAFTWHPGSDAPRASEVEVTFQPAGAGTLVTLTHRGWERFAEPESAREEYDHGWPMVLDRYRAAVDSRGTASSDDVEAADVWVALVHAPAGGAGAAVFQDPRFAEHLAFLGRMRDAGYLVAAGQFGDGPGEGMTILRLPGADGLERARALAEADPSVTGGLFEVRIRPWSVALTG
jgi:uncharacterized protein YciI